MSVVRASLVALVLASILPLHSATAEAQGVSTSGIGRTGPNDRRPLDIEADNGIEWQQNNEVYIARGNAKATRGNATLYADVLIAHYRPAAPSGPQAAGQPPAPKPPAARSEDASASTGSTEIYRVEAEGHVRLQTETQVVYGDHGVYDVDRATGVFTGKDLRLVTTRDTVTARDSLEWYDDRQIAVARGDAVAIQDQKRLAGDVLIAQVVKPPDQASRISRIDAQGHVLVSTINEIARGASGVYNVDTGIATLAGGVTMTRGDNTLRGQYGVVDMNNNVSRLLSALPGEAHDAPVQAIITPRKAGEGNTDSGAPGGKKPAGQKAPAGSAQGTFQ
jgi:lipopolysaccharide export system protein LptA